MKSSIPLTRLCLYALVGLLLPFLAIGGHYLHAKRYQESIAEEMTTLRESCLLKRAKQAGNQQVRACFQGSDCFYVNREIVPLPLLRRERAQFDRLAREPHWAQNPAVKRRLRELEKNHLEFSEGRVDHFPFFKEVVQTQSHPVQVEVEDIREVLDRLEGEEHTHRPQIIITDFTLDRKSHAANSKLYSLQIKLVKREYF